MFDEGDRVREPLPPGVHVGGHFGRDLISCGYCGFGAAVAEVLRPNPKSLETIASSHPDPLLARSREVDTDMIGELRH